MEIYCRMGHIVCDDWCQTEEESKERFQGILRQTGWRGLFSHFVRSDSRTDSFSSIQSIRCW